MKILTIFAPCLYAVKYQDEDFDELERLFDEWDDIENLECFFEENQTDLGYYQMDVKEAIRATKKEAREFRKQLLSIVESKTIQLDSIFQNLVNSDFRIFELSKQKSRRRWLRLYAIRIDENVFLITGGAIKLTRTMGERPHTTRELKKLELSKNFLKMNHIFDCDSFHEMIHENYENNE